MARSKMSITSLEELQYEERQVRQRIKAQEKELGARLQQLPEELITVGLVRLVSGIIEGNVLKYTLNFVKKIGKNLLSKFFKDIL